MVDRAVSRDPVVKFMLEKLEEVRCNAPEAWQRLTGCDSKLESRPDTFPKQKSCIAKLLPL